MAVYAVKVGRKPGVYKTWKECQQQVTGFSGPVFKKFDTEEQALEFIGVNPDLILPKNKGNDVIDEKYCQVYVDGSYSDEKGKYGYGFVILEPETHKETTGKGNGDDARFLSARNVAGEIFGTAGGINTAMKMKHKYIVVYHDYEGIAKWANGDWDAKSPIAKMYKEYISRVKNDHGVILKFIKVRAHTGDKYNEMADDLARESLL